MSDLDLALREAGSDLRLHTPLADVVTRGARLRRRRRGVRLGVGAVVLVAVGGVVSVALPSGSSPLPTAVAGWGPRLVNLSDTQLADADADCREMFQQTEVDVPGAAPVLPYDVAPLAADTRGDTTVLVYRFGGVVNACSLSKGQAFGMAGAPWDMILPGHHVHYLTGGGTRPPVTPSELRASEPPDLPVTDGMEVVRVSDDVARPVLHVAGQDFEARVGDGIAVSWVPQGVHDSDLLAATVTAYDADGGELESDLLFAPDPRPDL